MRRYWQAGWRWDRKNRRAAIWAVSESFVAATRGLELPGAIEIFRMAKKAGGQNSYAEADQQKHSRAPCRARRKPIRGQQGLPSARRKPAALFLAVERVSEAGAAAREQSGVGLGVIFGEKSEKFFFAFERLRSRRGTGRDGRRGDRARRLRVRRLRRKASAAVATRSMVRVGQYRRCVPIHLEVPHRMPSRLSRSLRVARNSEFFTVSSDVPSRSPMARSRRP